MLPQGTELVMQSERIYMWSRTLDHAEPKCARAPMPHDDSHLRLGQFNPNLQVEFCYDSLNAGRNSQGSCASSLGKPNQLAMRGIFQLLENMCVPKYTHVKAHSGDPLRQGANIDC